MPSDDPLDEGWLPDIDDPELDLDDLIEQITVDAYGDEGYWSFRQAFEDHVQFPLKASAIGVEVTVSEIDFDGDERRGLTASVERDDRAWTVSLLDIEITADQHRVVRLVAAYRRWLGIDQ
ncbi:MAG: hypothetical protein H6516_15370 [Microthrixaceae bacterium]|nr:hypothetical protein [Microthrixaceae bacterium]